MLPCKVLQISSDVHQYNEPGLAAPCALKRLFARRMSEKICNTEPLLVHLTSNAYCPLRFLVPDVALRQALVHEPLDACSTCFFLGSCLCNGVLSGWTWP